MNKKKKYLYLDDEKDASVNAIIEGFNNTDIIEVEECMPDRPNFEKVIDAVAKRLKSSDGIILDLKLNGAGEQRVPFTATTLAQYLRSFFIDKAEKEKPIILCSTKLNDNKHYQEDKTAHDLYDFTFDKSGDINYYEISKKLVSISEAYSRVQKTDSKNVFELFNREDLCGSPAFEPISGENLQANKIVSFVLKDLFTHNGPLISEKALAARLGVDIESCKSDWECMITKYFAEAKYSGILSDIENYYWNDLSIKTFKSLADGKGPAAMGAKKRVDILKRSTNLKGLTAAQPIELCHSDFFWTICEGYEKPLDPTEGYMIMEENDLKSWQEPLYVSLSAFENGALEDKHIKLTPSEEERAKCDLELLDKG
mgnify:CR=1 FL=1